MLLVFSSCKSETCVQGMQIACACGGGANGFQTCQSDGTYGACQGCAAAAADMTLPPADMTLADLTPPPDMSVTHIVTPLPPDATHFMWQSLQERFMGSNGSPCQGRITLSVSDHAVCYGAADDSLRCAGTTYMTNFGTSFVPVTGVGAVDQILLSATFNSATGNAMCVHGLNGSVSCFGDYNSHGEFADGNTSPAPTWVQWNGAGDLHRIATGTWDQICTLSMGGTVSCSGYNFGATPVVKGMNATSVYVDTFGAVQINDANTLRASNGRTQCFVTAAGLSCFGTMYGTAGDVVDGGQTASAGLGPMQDACWLTSAGKVNCVRYDMMGNASNVSYFGTGTVVALAVNFYTSSICAVYNDGSLWCFGDNSKGQLGTGDTSPVVAEKMVQPPGSLRTTCD
jgi:hypothetical protein